MRPRAADGLEVHLVDDGYVVHDVVAGRVHHLNLSSSLVFELSDGSRDVEAIAAEVGAAFGLDATPLDDTTACVTQLLAEGVLVDDAAPDPAGQADQAAHQSGSDS